MEDPTPDIQLALASHVRETKRLEEAYAHLQHAFYSLKEKLESSHNTLEKITTHMSEGLIFVTIEGTISLFNPAAGELTGYLPEKILHSPYDAHFSDSLFGFSMQKAVQHQGLHQRIFLTLNDEKELEVSTSFIPEQGVLLLLTDRSEQQKLAKSLSHANHLKELGEMAATLAHEIRNPLGGIEGFAQLLKRDLEAPDHQKMIKAILEGTQTLNHLVTNVLDYARPMKLHFAHVDLVALVRDTVALLRAEKQNLSYHLHLAYTEYLVSVDQGRIKLALLNLLRNASEAHATQVDILLTKEGALIIKDNGRGISQKNLEKIFSPFFTTKTTGTGLGLAETQSVVEAHGGKLEVSSEEGKGTDFTLILQKNAC